MKISIRKQLYLQKMEEILDLCNGDVRDSVEYLKSEFDVPEGYAFTRHKKDFEKLIALQTEKDAKSDRMAEFLEKLKGNGYDDKILD